MKIGRIEFKLTPKPKKVVKEDDTLKLLDLRITKIEQAISRMTIILNELTK